MEEEEVGDVGEIWLAGVLAENSPSSLSATKKLLAAQSKAWLDAAVELGMDANAGARETKDFYEGVTAFLEKRKAVWAGGDGAG